MAKDATKHPIFATKCDKYQIKLYVDDDLHEIKGRPSLPQEKARFPRNCSPVAR